MKIAHIAFLALLGCLGAVAVAAVALVISVIFFQPRPTFDRAHPDYEAAASQFAQARSALAAGEDRAVIDLATVNGGAWRTACLFGGFTRPVQRLEGLGAKVKPADRQRLAKAFGWRAAPVEEFEMLIAFEDEEGQAHFVHFDHGVGAEGQHYEACVTKPRTKVAVATWRTEPPGTPPLKLD